MTATNHALTGALIGCMIGNPWVAVPVAFTSHFVLDAIPHYGAGAASLDKYLRSKGFAVMLSVDALLCVALVAVLAVTHPAHWLLAAICAFIATSPDLAWLPGYVRTKAGKHFRTKRQNAVLKFAAVIQWFEKPIGGVVELAWAAAVVTLLIAYLR